MAKGGISSAPSIFLTTTYFTWQARSYWCGSTTTRAVQWCIAPSLGYLQFSDFLSKNYLEQISILGPNEWEIRQNKGLLFLLTFKIDITKVPLFLWIFLLLLGLKIRIFLNIYWGQEFQKVVVVHSFIALTTATLRKRENNQGCIQSYRC